MKDKIKEKKKRQREFENNQKIWEKKKKHDNTGKLRAMNNIQAEVDPGEKLERDKYYHTNLVEIILTGVL